MATYVNNLRLKEITTGDEDGTWGTSTNTNLELITDGFSYGTKQMAADANETFTMPDATADDTRSFYLKITSAVSLTATRTITLGPNTVSKVWMIENATSGSQSISISQGSGANVTVPNGSKVMIVTDGAGAGAAVFNANPTEVGGTVTSVGGTGTVNGITLTGTVTSSGNLTLGGTLSNVNLTSQVTGTLPVANGGTGVTSSTGTGSVVLSTSPTFTTPNLGTPSAATLTNATGLPIVAGTTGTLSVARGGTGSTTASGALTNLGLTATATELNYTDGVTSAIQTQLNAKQATITGGATSITSSNLTVSRALVSDGSGKVAVSAVTSTEVGYLDGVTSAIQTQLNAKGVGSVTSVAVSGGTTGLTTSGGPITGSGTITLAGTLAVANGGTGVTSSTGSGSNVLSTSPTLVTPVLGTPSSGNLSNCTADGTNDVGFKNVPQNSQNANYTLVLSDSGKHIAKSDTTTYTWTIPANASVAFPIGTAITFVNYGVSGNVTIDITSDTLILGGDGNPGFKTLYPYGIATAIKVATTTWIISGTGID
jgi:hypothetical protein